MLTLAASYVPTGRVAVYAPNVTDRDIGGKYYGQHPVMLRMSPGHDDVIIFFAGVSEKAQILAESEGCSQTCARIDRSSASSEEGCKNR